MPPRDIPISNKLWLSVSQAANLFGVEQKTIRRAIKEKRVDYVVEENRYSLEMGSLIKWAHSNTKLFNKLEQHGLGKFVKEWREDYISPSNELSQ